MFLKTQQFKHKQMTSQKPKKYDYMSKLVIVGDASVGKTNILLRFTEDNFRMLHNSTIGVDFKIKTLEVQDKKIRFTLWDTAGQDRFRNLTSNYYKGSDGVIFAYSVSDRNSFNNIQNWINSVQENTNKEVCKLIVGNKVDLLERERQVTTQEGQKIAQKLNIPFLQVSAKQNILINQLFQTIGKMVKEKIQKQESYACSRISICRDKKSRVKKQNCC